MQKYSFEIFSKFRGELMGIAILGVCLLHAFEWAGFDDSMVAKVVGPFARIAFTDGFLFLSGFGLYYSFSKNRDKKTFYQKRFNRVLLPYMMMGVPFFLYGLIWGDITWDSPLWKEFHCKWIETHRDGGAFTKLSYLLKGFLLFLLNVPFYDIVHIHTSEPPSALRKVLFMAVSKLLGKKVMLHFHSFSVDTTIKSKYQWVYRYLFGKADCVLVLSKYWQDEICKIFGFKEDKVKVLYNPCTTEVSDKVCPKKKEILYAGTVNARKGYADMIKAFAKVAEKHKDWNIVFAGNGEIEEGKVLATQLGIAEQTVFLGWVRGEDKDKAFKEASVFCLPSYAEGFPMGVLDAWAYGLPVITTPVGGIPDIAVDGKNCLLFNPGDVDKLAEQMERMMDSEKLRMEIAEESSELAKGVFSVWEVTKRLASVYCQYIGFFHR